MYELIICEKPAAANKIAEALADGKAIKENYQGVPYYKLTHGKKDIVVACAVGHLYGLSEKVKKGWIFPVFDIEWQPVSENSKGAAFTKKYLNTIKKLAKDANEFTVATDFDQEGEVIGLNIVRYLCKKKDANRMKFSTLTKDELRESYKNKSKHIEWGQAESGEARHFLDFYNGINYSRALTAAIKTTGTFKLMSTGRVQGPALKIIVDREKEIKAFVSKPFWQLQLIGEYEKETIVAWHEQKIDKDKLKSSIDRLFKKIDESKIVLDKSLLHLIGNQQDITKKGKIILDWQDVILENINDNEKKEILDLFEEIKKLMDTNKFWEKEKADAVIEKTKNQKEAKVDNLDRKQFNQMPPFPFDLTSLQVEGYRCHGISPKEILEIGQELYTSGYISYPRTSSQQLPPAIGYMKVLNDLNKQKQYSDLIKKLLKKPSLRPNNGKKTDPAHPAIYPTGIIPAELTERESKIYDLIVKRFLATFSENAVRETMTADLNCNNEIFIAKGTRTIEKGWHEFYSPYVNLEEIELPNMKKDDKIKVSKIELISKETQPPKRYTPASIIKDLEKRNLGTKATRSEIVDTLFQRGYVQGKAIEATNLGISMVETLEKYCPKILDEDLTRRFEMEMDKIREGQQKKEQLLEDAKDAIIKITTELKKHQKEIGTDLQKANKETQDEMSFLGICPACKQGNITMRRGKFGAFASCNRYPDCKTIFSIPKNALIKPAKKDCEVCGYPKVLAIKKARQPMEFCLNPKCPTKLVEGQAGVDAKAIATGEVKRKCPKCTEGDIVLRSSIYGKFLACNRFPKCRYTEKLVNHNNKDNDKENKE